MFNTQTERAQYYQTWMNSLLAAKVSSKCNCASAGTFPIVGMAWWQYTDMRSERANWGLVTPRDNPYDGVSATTSEGYDSWGYPTGCLAAFGCERANYGDFIDEVTRANLEVLKTLAR